MPLAQTTLAPRYFQTSDHARRIQAPYRWTYRASALYAQLMVKGAE